MKSGMNAAGIALVVLACVLLIGQRLLSAYTPLWADALAICGAALCLLLAFVASNKSE